MVPTRLLPTALPGPEAGSLSAKTASTGAALPRKVPRVTIYDAALRRVGQVESAADVNRSYVLDEPGHLDFMVRPDEEIVSKLSPIEGRIAVVESDVYPYPWVGKIVSLRRNRRSGSINVSAVGFEQILEYRYTGAALVIDGSVELALRQVLAALNADNPTGILIGNVGGAAVDASTSFVYANGREALDALAELAGAEWWIEPMLTSAGLEFRLHFRPWRGFDRSSEAPLVDQGNCYWTDWTMDGEALTYGLTVLGGEASGTQSISERAAATVRTATVSFVGPHGYSRFGPVEGTNILNRQDRFTLIQQLRSAGQMEAAAEVMLARQRIGGVALGARLSVRLDATVWARLDVGSVIECRLPSAFLDGFDGPARILGVQPMEEDGMLDLSLELLRKRS